MVGHGRPREGPQRFVGHREQMRQRKIRLGRVLRCYCALFLCAAHFLLGEIQSEELDVRIRVLWGGGTKRQWRGAIVASEGRLLKPTSLGFEAEVPDDLVLERDTLRWTQPIPIAADGLDLQVVGTEATTLTFEFTPLDKPETAKKIELPLRDFVSMSTAKFVHDGKIDDLGNSLQVQRAPGDRIRIELDRRSLVFSPGEELTFSLQPHELGIAPGAQLRCTVQLQPVDSEEVLWKEPRDFRIDTDGTVPLLGPIKVKLPEEEGVYDILISLAQRRFTDTLVPAKPLMQRKIQLIVLATTPQPVDPEAWELVDEIDSSNPKWWERLNWLSHWSVLPGIPTRGPLGDRPLESRNLLGQQLHQLGPNGWHAAPIPTAEIGHPHLLEIEYPNDQKQTLGISIVEPNAAGEVRTSGIDTGIDNSGHPKPAEAQLEKHRVIFWPRTKTPWLVLTNRRDNTPANFGKIRVFAGPARLASAVTNAPESESPRLLAAYYDKPLFTENFAAADALDVSTGRSHKDWQTFYLGGLRLAEYLKHAGYNAAIIAVACDGGTLYRSDFLTATPKFDDGIFFQSGQDPFQKDVLEMLLRIFDREGLKLIPAVEFGVPLSALEEKRRAGQNDLDGIAMIGFAPNDLKAKFGQIDSRLGAAPFYNPLDHRVQSAMRQVTSEVLTLSAHHPCFGGLAVQLSPHGYAVLPDQTWCLDDATFARFAQATQQPNPTGSDRLVQRLKLVREGPARDQWLRWRAEQLTNFYAGLSDDVTGIAPHGELLLMTTDLLSGKLVQNALRPRLPTRLEFGEAMIQHGIDAASLAVNAHASLLRPHRLTTSQYLSAYAMQLDPAQGIVDEFFRKAGQTSSVTFNDPQALRLPEFDKASPFGAERTAMSFSAQIIPAGNSARARFVQDLAALDSLLIADGGQMLSLGQEDRLNQFARVYRGLPADSFTSIPSDSVGSSQIAVRVLNRPDRTYLYVANPQGMATTVQVELETSRPCSATSLDDRPPPVFQPLSVMATNQLHHNSTTWTISLEPYDVAAIVCSANDVKVRNWTTQIGVAAAAEITELVQELRKRVEQLNKFQPVKALANPDFEQVAQAGQIPGWQFARTPGVTVDLDGNQPYQGRNSLHLRVEGAKTLGWIRSQPFALPRTGRIAIQAWIRGREGNRQPPLRISVMGNLANGQTYTRWSAIGVDIDGRTFQPTQRENVPPVASKWSTPVLLPLADLPVSTSGDISVGFEMLGAGEVWIDQIEVSDIYFPPDEHNALLKNVFFASSKLGEGDLAYCEQSLQSYWARFILEHVPPPRVAQLAAPDGRGEINPTNPPPAGPEPSKWKVIPQIKFPLRK